MPAFSKIVKFKDYYFGVDQNYSSYGSYYSRDIWRSTNKINWVKVRAGVYSGGSYYPSTDIAVTENRLWILDYWYANSTTVNTCNLYYSTDGAQFYTLLSGKYLGPMLSIGNKLFLCKRYSSYGRSGYYFTANEGSSWSEFNSPESSGNSAVIACPYSGYPAEVRSYFDSSKETIKLCVYNGSSWTSTVLPDLPESEYDPETYEEIGYSYADPLFCGTKVVIPIRRDIMW